MCFECVRLRRIWTDKLCLILPWISACFVSNGTLLDNSGSGIYVIDVFEGTIGNKLLIWQCVYYGFEYGVP